MNPQRWQRIEELYEGYLAQPEAEREAWLGDATTDDPTLMKDLSVLLQEGTPGESIAGIPAPIALGDDTLGPGDEVGPYRLVEIIGRGGMGQVFLARRQAPFEQDVALKIVRRGVDTEDVLARFQAERQILANLSHPNVARLLDGGATSDGRPYLVMEYVAGLPIDEHCDHRSLSLRDRLRLLQEVCAAVHAAHQSLVVHRDLKPHNILVTDAGQVKLLDFGIAKLLEPGPDTANTHQADRLLTPDYASPEQLRGETLTTVSDVYALGILMYRVLAGRAPYHLAGKSPTEVDKLLREANWPRPSLVCDAPYARSLRKDLDNVVAKASHSDPDRRYLSAMALADDLQRYLDRQPVTARPDTWRYRASRFVVRNRVGVSVALAFLVTLSSFSVVTWRQSHRITSSAEAATRERDAADAVVEYLVGLFRQTDPLRGSGDISAKELLELGGERLSKELEEQPLVRARIRVAMAQALRNAGDLDAAEASVAEAVSLLRAHPDPPTADLVRALQTLGVVLDDLGRAAEAIPLLREAVRRSESELGEEHEQTAASLFSLAEFHRRAEPALADSLYSRVLEIRRRSLPSDSPSIASVLRARAGVLRFDRRYREAEVALLEALRIKRAAYGENTVHEAPERNALGALYTTTQRLNEAEEQYRLAESTYVRELGADHPHVDTVRFNRARVAHLRGDYPGAASLLREVLEQRTARLGPTHLSVARVHVQMGRALTEMLEFEAAATELVAALTTRREILGDDDWRTAYALAMLGHCLRRSGEHTRGESMLREALTTIARERGENHSVTQSIRELLEEPRD